MSNSQKKVLITPGLYFPNYYVTYLPRDISRDFTKCEHVNPLAVFKELYYMANDQKMADKKKADYQECLEKRRADSAARSHDKTQRKVVHETVKVIRKRVVLTVQQEATKVNKSDLEKSSDDSAARSRES